MPHGDNATQTSIATSDNPTLPKMLLAAARNFGDDRIALREKEFGIWRPITWKLYLDNVRHIALGLASLGLKRGEKAAMIGDNRPEGLWAEMGIMCAGGVAVWLFQDCMLDEVVYIINHSDARFLFVEGQEEVDKGLSILDKCPNLERIIWDDPKGMRDYDHPILLSLKKLIAIGQDWELREPGLFERMVAAGNSTDVALLFYTSGTTALPKGALLSHQNMISMGKNMMTVDPCFPEDSYVSYLPFAWIGEQMMSVSSGLRVGFTINFPEEPESNQENIREIAPHVMFAPPRMYEQMTRTVQVKHLDSSWIKRKMFDLAMKIGYWAADLKFEKKYVPFYVTFLRWLAHITVFKKLRDHLGLVNIRNAYTGGAAMGPEHFRFFHAIGVNLKQIYGQTEIAGISVLHRNGDVKFDTVGTPLPETEIRITSDGEIISRSPSVFLGYYKNPEATAKSLREDWLYSGDKGFIDDDGHLVVFDRTADVMTLSDGSIFAPQYLETRLKFSPYVKDAWVIGNNRPFMSAVICIDYAVVGKWADERKLNYTSYQELSQKKEVYDLVEKQISEANRGLKPAARIHRFVNMFKEFDADDEELTRTRKIRRGFLETRYQDILAAIYEGKDNINIDTSITYEDGRVIRIKADLHVQKIKLEEGK